MPITPAPPSPGPSAITFAGVPLGSVSRSAGAHLFKTNASVYARIEGDTHNVFSVTGLASEAYVHDPDLPLGKKMWDPVLAVDGEGPIFVRSGQALAATVMFRALTSITEPQLTATVVLSAAVGGPAILSMPIKATLDLQGSVHISTETCDLFSNGIQPGETKSMVVQFTSTSLTDVSGTFGLVPGSTTAFSSPVTVPVTVPAQSSVTVSIPVSCIIGAGSGNTPNVLFQFLCTDGRYNTTLSVSIDVVFPVLVSNTNYYLEESGNSILGLSVRVDVDTDIVSSKNGWSMQLNGYSPAGNGNGWQQYVIWARPGETQVWAKIDNWDSAMTQLINVDTALATLPSNTVPSGYSLTITLLNDASGNITGATYSIADKQGTSIGSTSLLILDQTLLTTSKPATTADQAPIEAFEFNIVGYGNSQRATLTSGQGWITYAALNPLTVVDTVPGYVNNTNIITAETANLIYGDNPAISASRVVQVFQVTSALAPHVQERVRARELSLANTGHALPQSEHLTTKDQAAVTPDAALDAEPGSPGPSDALKALAKERASWG